jgi:hypothetical protein
MKVKILKIRRHRKQLVTCDDFAKLKWPAGTTDYLHIPPKGNSPLIVGHHVSGFTLGVKRQGVQGFNLFPYKEELPTEMPETREAGYTIFVRINRKSRTLRTECLEEHPLAQAIIEETLRYCKKNRI